MKKVMMVLLAFLMVGGFAFAATDSDTLYIEGTVSPILSIEVSQDASADELVLGLGQSRSYNDGAIAITTEISNYPQGYTLKANSANDFKLKSSTNVAGSNEYEFLDYSIKWGNVVINSINDDTSVISVSKPTDEDGTVRDIAIAYSSKYLMADTFSDTITFTITTN